MDKEHLEDIKRCIKNSDYKNHYRLQDYFEVAYIDELVNAYEKLKEELEEETLNKEIAQGHRKQVQDIELQERHELADYKSRCEKAIKYIDTNFCIENRRDLKEVVNILQNGIGENHE